MDGENYTSQEVVNQNGSSFKNFFSFRSFFVLFTILIIANLIYLNILAFRNKVIPIEEKKTAPSVDKVLEKPTEIKAQVCPLSCIDLVNEATSSLKLTSEAATPTAIPTPANVSESLVKEFFVPFGSGSSSAGDWEDIRGIQASVDSTNYPNIKSVTFEASVRIPTGNEIAYIRLFNVTDKHPVWDSEVSLEGGTPKLLVSKPITLGTGSKLYQVQMKTSLKFQAIFDQARLHIITY